MTHIIELPFAYRFDEAISRLSLDPLNSVDLANQIVRVPLDHSIITVKSIGSHREPKFILTGIESDEQLQRILSIFHFDRSLDAVHAHFIKTNLKDLFLKFEGTPIITDFSLYENIIKSIIHQQLNLSFARTLTTRFVQTFGEQIDGVWIYPTADKIAKLEVDTLRGMQFSTRKAEYIIGISKAIATEELKLNTFVNETDETIMKKLTSYRGIGPWTAESFLLFGLGRENLFPLGDIGLQNSLKQMWNMEKKPSKEEIIIHFESWSPYLSYASLYLWRNIE
ncbi:DNA-3-methyladenine glycosylase [Psychrobacillus sp. FJAT-21963]|uniref:DNA-3-methyladenine glycosylase family protein n=1 Tax=Psychrobacillus sp. FJAT-21963 TaxID=1712028 RepID=UPI0006FD21B7|nr:DNA-3-methyladenine glycosylase [Psychrobacillus sp. FJAT-21963]KQL36653.1 DNA-3-methyladenine glycosylase [Psychrobacillus sp. FJAT-21963]